MASSDKLPSVAIAGATGHLGSPIAVAFLEPRYRSRFDKIVLLMRKPVDDVAKLLGVNDASGVTVRIYDENSIQSSIADIDIVICTIGPRGDDFRKKLIPAMAQTGVKLYFPSEFGIYHGDLDFSHPEWHHKDVHYELAHKTLTNAKICRVYSALLLEDSIGPWFGYNTKDAKYECIGSADTPNSFTSLLDVGRVVAELSSMPIDKVPASLRIGGDTKSFNQIASMMESAGSSPIEVSVRDLAQFKQETLQTKTTDPANFLRFLMGEGKLNHGKDNDNSLVNPNEANWKWKTLSDLAKETNGRPWADFK